MTQLVVTVSNQAMVDNSKLDMNCQIGTISSNLRMGNKEHTDNRVVMVSSNPAMDNRKHLLHNKPAPLDVQSPKCTQAATTARIRGTMHMVHLSIYAQCDC